MYNGIFIEIDIVRIDYFVGLFCKRDCFTWVDILFVLLRLVG